MADDPCGSSASIGPQLLALLAASGSAPPRWVLPPLAVGCRERGVKCAPPPLLLCVCRREEGAGALAATATAAAASSFAAASSWSWVQLVLLLLEVE